MTNRLAPSFLLFAFAFSAAPAVAQAQGPATTSLPASGGPAAVMVGGTVSVTRDSVAPMGHIPGSQDQTIPAVRSGEYEAAPWIDNIGGPQNTGRILMSAGLPGIAMAAHEKVALQAREKVYIVAPSGATAAAGQTFMSFAPADVIGLDAQVLVPTGILRVDQSGAAGEAAVASIMKQFGHIGPRDEIVPFVPMGAPRMGLPTAVNNGAVGKISWVSGNAVLPQVLSYVIVDAGEAAGVRPGDIFTIVRPRVQLEDGTWLPEKEIARASVVKVAPRGSTLIVIDQTEPAIKVGSTARLTARMP